MKTAGVGPILSIMCVGLASACGSQVSIGHNDPAVTADSGQQGGQGQPSGTGGGQAWVNMGMGTTSFAGMAGSAGGSVGPPPNIGIGLSAASEAEPGTVVELDGGSGACAPVDTTGAEAAGSGWLGVPPGIHNVGCGSRTLPALDIKAVYSTAAPEVVRTWNSIGPPYPPFGSGPPVECSAPPPDTLFFTAGVPEQLIIFDAPVHVDADQTIVGSVDIDNRTGDLLGGGTQHYLLTSAPSGGLGCGPARGLAGGVQTSWELNPGEETSVCVRSTLRWDHSARYIRIESPSGTYRSVFSIGNPTGQDGPSFCDESGDADHVLGYGVDGGTVEARLWDGHMAAGQQIVLRVNARNLTAERQTGTVSADLN